jgi:hypothetical protein
MADGVTAPLPAPSKFEKRAPNTANAVDIFAGHWAVDLSKINPALASHLLLPGLILSSRLVQKRAVRSLS